jgi:hypothetical protein
MDKQPIQFFKTAARQDIINYISEFLLERQKEKNILYTLGQVELRSLFLPGISYLNNLMGDYYGWAESLGFKNRLEKFKQWGDTKELNKRNVIYCDSREQNLLSINKTKTLVTKLEYGDYAFSNAEWTGRVAIERKSGADFIVTMVGGYRRFINEVERANKDGAYLIVLVEAKLSDMLDYRNKRIVNYKIRFPVAVIFHSVRELMQNYNNIQFLFVNSHESAGQMVEKLFSLGKDIKRYDLQLLKDLDII